MTDSLHLNHVLSPLVKCITDGRFGNANRQATVLRKNAEAWWESLNRSRNDAKADHDDIVRDKPAASPDAEPGEWHDWEHRCKDAHAKVDALSELASAVYCLSEALRRIGDESSNRVCDRESSDPANS
jgi:hypothetical protein